ncbi:hypothetical protein WJX73_009098 [Symbiochloris irregularis]|uniref:Uncharacterized protein n=1 Tax=Symbiochloris irregularis TaxID=706552 RepID=A0AAW1PEX9_9CHLO
MAVDCEAQFRQLVQATLWSTPILPTGQAFEEHYKSLSTEDTLAVYDVYRQAFFLAKSYTQADISKSCEEPQLTAKLQALSELCQQEQQNSVDAKGSPHGSQFPEQLAAHLRRKAKCNEIARLDLALQEAQEQAEAAEAQLVMQQQRLAGAISQVEGKAGYLNKVSQASVQWNSRPAMSTQ